MIFEMLRRLINSGNFSTPAGEKLYQTALSCLGKDIAPRENEFGCAESVNNLVFMTFGDYAGGDLSTHRMYLSIRNNVKFAQVSSPLKGDIIISPTGFGNGKIKNGHTGIMDDKTYIMSNDSKTGKFVRNFTLASWKQKYQAEGGFPVYFFRRVLM